MKRLSVFALWLVLAACGKVGDPRPPFVRIPESVKDLAARQEGYDVLLSWTNPARYIDGSLATDLLEAQVFRNGSVVATTPVPGAGMPQSYAIDVRENIEVEQAYEVRIRTAGNRESARSNVARINPVEVPGAVLNLRAVVDQGRIVLQWDRPDQNTGLAEVYLVQRADRAVGEYVMSAPFADSTFEVGREYSYRVTAGRREPAFIPGSVSSTITVAAVDKTAPGVPTGLEVTMAGDGALLTWSANPEADLAGYRILRSERRDGGFAPVEQNLHSTNAFFDPAFRSGLFYAVSAVDGSGNISTPAIWGQ